MNPKFFNFLIIQSNLKYLSEELNISKAKLSTQEENIIPPVECKITEENKVEDTAAMEEGAWNQHFNNFAKFYHQNLFFPPTDTSLGKWACRQRTFMRRNQLLKYL